ncbi:hypothetical protein CFN78_16130 [Amycolatopsis antarctica]|uniref:Uncharacterized protein n=1 Tax=Amycolatopsis antarctica TaxID=1854586 RepID=A0A263D0W4_9PSEU|nr:hypothetical protein [Amycolatopsis antarctica]OZM72073.1 hypothetical protein CFN78_16130 [Amycolatopsis antarctica]
MATHDRSQAPGKRNRTATILFASALAAAALATTSQTAAADGDGGTYTRGPAGKDPAAIQLERENAAVAAGPLSFGAEPLQAVEAAAAKAAPAAGCPVTAAEATALTLAPTWPEVASGSTEPPSPMTLSRFDNQASLYDPEGRPGLFFNPGIGMWQLDSAGLGADNTAFSAIDAVTAADKMAPYIVNKYCAGINGGSAPAAARATAWRDWHACDEGACEDTYTRALAGVTPVAGVGRYGGAVPTTCTYKGAQYPCLFVDPAKAQGANWWAQPGGGRAPVPAPFHAFTYESGGTTFEVRYWLPEHSGAPTPVSVSRQFGTDARAELRWENAI